MTTTALRIFMSAICGQRPVNESLSKRYLIRTRLKKFAVFTANTPWGIRFLGTAASIMGTGLFRLKLSRIEPSPPELVWAAGHGQATRLILDRKSTRLN